MKSLRFRKFLRILTAFVTVLAVNAAITMSYAPAFSYSDMTEEELMDRIDQIKQDNDQRRDEIASLDDDISYTQTELDKIADLLGESKNLVDYYNNLLYYKDQDIKEIEGDISKMEQDISVLEQQIDKAQQGIIDKEKENAENLEKFAQIIRTMYTSNNADTFGVLSGTTDFYQLMVGTEIMGNITEKNEEFMNKLQADIKQLEADKNMLETDKANLLIDKQKCDDKKQVLLAEKEELDEFYSEAIRVADDYQADYNTYQATLDSLEYQQDNLEYLISIGESELEDYEEQLKQLIIDKTTPGGTLQDAEWIWPVPGFSYISCYFGWDYDFGRWHKGIDVGDYGIWGSNIYSTKGGTVIIAEDWYIPGYSYGKYVVVDHGGGYTSTYAHMDTVNVYVGQQVSQGDVLGTVGNTGWSTGPHLHFEIRKDGEAEDPFWYVDIV